MEKAVRAKKLFNFRPVFFFALALIFGILFCYGVVKFSISLWWLCFLLPIALTIGGLFYFQKIPKKPVTVPLIVHYLRYNRYSKNKKEQHL